MVIFMTILVTVLSFAVPTFGQSLQDTLNQINQEAKLPSFDVGHPDASVQPGASNITSAILYAMDLGKYLLGSVAVIIIIASGVRLVTAGKKIEDIAGKQKENLKYAVIGLIVIIGADALVRQIFFGEHGEVYNSTTDLQAAAERGNEQIRGLYSLMSMLIGALAVLMMVISGFMLVTGAGKEDANTKAKKQIMWAIIGLIVVGLAEFVVKDIVFPKQGSQLSDIQKAQELLINFTNFVSGFIATIAVAMYMYGGYLYVIDTGKEEQSGKAKKVFIGATIGLLIAMAAYGLVHTFVEFKPPTEAIGQPVNQPPLPTP